MRKISKVLVTSVALLGISAAPFTELSNHQNAFTVKAQSISQDTVGNDERTILLENETANSQQNAHRSVQADNSGEQAADNNEQAANSEEQDTMSDEQASSEQNNPTIDDQQAVDGEQQAVDNDQASGEQNVSEEESDTADSEQETGRNDQETAPVKQRTISADEVVLTGNDRYQFTKNSNLFFINGKKFASDEKAIVVNGTTYVQFKSIATAYGFKVGYNNKTKQSTATSGNLTIAFKINDNTMTVNGKAQKMNENSILLNGNLMVPLRAWANATQSSLEVQKSYIRVVWNTLPKATFTINEQEIIAKETKVTVTDKSSTSLGATIVEESWEGLEEIYNELGEFTITRRVKDSRGFWSEPYSVQINVLKPNEPPVANFFTNKTTYKIGEPVYYTNTSTDSDGRIISSVWSGNDPAFFVPGTHKITLQVHDNRRATSITEKTITVTNEVMYNREQFYLNFSAPGDKIPVEPGRSLQLPTIGYDIVPQDVTTVRMNSPEQISGPALDYSDTLSGYIRFSIHKQNISDQPLELHLIATNDGETTSTIQKLTESFAGPATYVSQSGKTATVRYLEQLLNPPIPEQITLEPGESKEILIGLPQISSGKIFSLFSDVYSEDPIRFTLVVTERKADPFAAMETLSQSEHDGKHTRGTFNNATRNIEINHIFGLNGGDKLIFGDRAFDQVISGVDAVDGREVKNSGNFDVVYNVVLNVAPHTAVLVNPRGGHYAGAFIVNDEVVEAANYSILKGQSEAALLYRSGNFHEKISISFVVAPGSNMPIHLMFLPVPSLNSDPNSNENANDTVNDNAADESTDETNIDQTVTY